MQKTKLTKLLLIVVALSHINLAFAHTFSAEETGNCPRGYIRGLTVPTDIPENYAGEIKVKLLPKNVCVKRYRDPGKLSLVNANFSVKEIVDIETMVSVKPEDYEPIVGHYNQEHFYTDSLKSDRPHFNDFSGAHPVMVKRNSGVSIQYVNGIYKIDRQTRFGPHSRWMCPKNYSTVGDSTICYSQKNGLRLNHYDKVELIPLPRYSKNRSTRQQCPLGYAKASNLGSNGGICTEVQALFSDSIVRHGLTIPQKTNCPMGEFTYLNNLCVPETTALYCREKKAKQGFVSVWHTLYANNINEIKTQNWLHQTTTGFLSPRFIRHYENHSREDAPWVYLTNLRSPPIPALHIFTDEDCSKLKRTGWSVEPIPYMW